MLLAYERKGIDREAVKSSLLGWINHLQYGDTWGLRKKVLKEVCL